MRIPIRRVAVRLGLELYTFGVALQVTIQQSFQMFGSGCGRGCLAGALLCCGRSAGCIGVGFIAVATG